VEKEVPPMSKRRRAASVIVLLFFGFLMNQACDKKEETKPAAPAPAAPAAPAPQASPAPAPDVAPSTAAPPAPQTASAKPALATADGEKQGSRVEIQELKRVSGGTVMIKLTLINDGDQKLSLGYDFGQQGMLDLNNIGGVHLIDPVGKKKYLVVRDSKNNCDCSRNVSDVGAKSRVNLWARFPAPPDDVEKIGVIVPHFSPLDDVPISR
jgi:hypothetical protein